MMLHMRLGLMVGLMLMTMALQAVGADLGKGRSGPDRAYYGPVYNWSGMYYGGTVGAADGGIGIAAHVGYNWMMPSHIVFGIEGEVGWLEDDRSHHSSGGVFGTLRGRAGYAFGRFMPYATAGVAVVDTDSSSQTGSTIGFGAEYAFKPGLTGRIEYLSIDTGTSRSDDTGLLRAGLSMRF